MNAQEVYALRDRVLDGHDVTKEEALDLFDAPLEALASSADAIRRHFCADGFDMCTIINGKSGRCSENCRFCAQSGHHHTNVDEYPLLDEETIVEGAKENARQGVLRYSIVTSGRRLAPEEVKTMARAVRRIREEVDIDVCVSFGLLEEEEFRLLKEAGVSRIHNNLETSERFFPSICSTHTFADKLQAIANAKAAGLGVCSGGIFGLGETVEDRIDMALTLRDLHIKSVPVNVLNPIPGTPLGDVTPLSPEEVQRMVAIYRFLLPDVSVRLAGGRGLLPDKGRACFTSGANAAISGDMLTTQGITVAKDRALLDELGYTLRHDYA